MKGHEEFNKIAVGTDHGGFELKQEIVKYMEEKGWEVEDFTPKFNNPIPFVPVAVRVCSKVKDDAGTIGILCCGTGVGMSIAANRQSDIRAAILYDDFTAEYSRRHNNANVLVFGGRTMKVEDVLRRIDIFLSNEFDGGKYDERNKSIEDPQL